jgi:hypothetical protein
MHERLSEPVWLAVDVAFRRTNFVTKPRTTGAFSAHEHKRGTVYLNTETDMP